MEDADGGGEEMIALTKTLDPADLDDLAMLDQLVIVDRHFDLAHTQRRWEYALALEAITQWEAVAQRVGIKNYIADVGGHGSPFHKMHEVNSCQIIDPEGPGRLSVEDVAGEREYDAVIAISTFEHTTTPLAFLEACHRILKPGGLLFLTFDYATGSEVGGDPTLQDIYHFHWMRERIMNYTRVRTLFQVLHELYGYEQFGSRDLTDHGPQVYDYSFCSLCIRKALDDASGTR